MNRFICTGILTVAAISAVLGPNMAQACGEGQFNAGQGMPFQGYLAARPVAVLVYAVPDPSATDARRQAVYDGLVRAGHVVTVAQNADELRRALAAGHVDVVIASFDSLADVTDRLASDGKAPALLPVVSRSEKNSPQVRGRFNNFLVSGAGVTQYLREIEKILPANAL